MDPILSRRQFIEFLTSQSLNLALTPTLAATLGGCVGMGTVQSIKGIEPTKKDDLVLAEGLSAHRIATWGQRLNPQGEKFGFNNDFTAFIPLSQSKTEAFLWVNHESVIPQFLHNKEKKQLKRSIREIIIEQEMVGGSILHIKKHNGQWSLVSNSSRNKRIHGRSKIPFSGNISLQGRRTATGTLANCAGGQTPWNTFLSCEENYADFYGEAFIENGKRMVRYKDKFNWYKHFPLPPEHYGWVVEIDPITGRAEKLVALGRAPHEGATVAVTKDMKVCVYMGEDTPGGFIFKFVSAGSDLKKGTLYAADTIKGRWLPLDIKKSPALQKVFKTQLDVLTYAHQSAELIGATPQDRPEGIAIHPVTRDVFISLTKNPENGNHFGSILKIQESGDHDATEMQASTWVSGGLKSGIACPDNLCFDKKGHLWVTVDVSEKQMRSERYQAFGNNGLFVIPTKGPQAGEAIQVASGPIDAELTGPSFSDDGQTLFLSVQHPGSTTRYNLKKPTSSWPHRKQGELPRSAVVAIQGDFFNQLPT